MTNNKTVLKNRFYFLLALLFVYVLLFDFILPLNKILPKPSLLFESLLFIWKDYNLLSALFVSATFVYVALILSFVFSYLNASWLFKKFDRYAGSILTLGVFKLIPVFFFAVLFNYWFPQQLLGELIFTIAISFFLITQKLFDERKNVKEEYLLVARNLNLVASDVYEQIYWKALLPVIIKYYIRVHTYLWGIVLTYEFFGNSHGVGSIFRAALSFNDFTSLITLGVLIALLIWFSDFVIKLIHKKIIFWDAE